MHRRARTGYLSVAALLILLTATACAPRAANIEPAYVSPQKYMGEDWTCEKLINEAVYVGDALLRASGNQDDAATTDAWTVFLIGVPVSGGGNEYEVARLKGEQEALRVAIRDKNCETPDSTAAN
jgi:hypothetical protein